MKKTIIILLLCIGYATAAHAQLFTGTAQYQLQQSDGNWVANNFVAFDGLADREIFAKAVLWTVENVCPQMMEGVTRMDATNLAFDCTLTLAARSGSRNTYTCDASFRAIDGKLMFTLGHIYVCSDGTLFKKNTPFERLSPDKKRAHKELMEEFVMSGSQAIASLVEYVRTYALQPLTHWEQIKARVPVKGMNEDECRLIYGKPQTVTVSGKETQWMFGGKYFIFFEDGKATTIIN